MHPIVAMQAGNTAIPNQRASQRHTNLRHLFTLCILSIGSSKPNGSDT